MSFVECEHTALRVCGNAPVQARVLHSLLLHVSAYWGVDSGASTQQCDCTLSSGPRGIVPGSVPVPRPLATSLCWKDVASKTLALGR